MNSNKQYKVILSKVEWCGHCKDFLPVFNESKNLIKNNKTFKNISVDFEAYDMEQDKGIFETKYKELVNKVEGYPTVFLAQIKNDKLSKTVEIGHAEKPGEFIKLISNAYESFSKQTGGNQEQEEEIYKQKYLKYKTKYLQYKIQLDNKVCHNCINSNQQTGGNYNQQTNRAVNNLKMDKNLCNNCGNYL